MVALCCASSLAAARQEPSSRRIPVVVVPGVTGSRLRNTASGEDVWGPARTFFGPKDRGHGLALPLREDDEALDPLEPNGTIFQVRLLSWTKEVYRPLRKAFEQAGYRLGDLGRLAPDADLFFFAYDWRQDNLDTAERLHRALELLASGSSDPRVHLVCQSNAARVCRWLAKYGGLSLEEAEAGRLPARRYRITKLILVGASNGGSMRQLHELHSGRKYVPGIGRFLGPETLFTLRTLFGDLPADREGLFVDADGRPLDVDLYDPASWTTYGWSIFDRDVELELQGKAQAEIFGERGDRVGYLTDVLDRARRVHLALDRASAAFGGTAIYLLLNRSGVAPTRAQIVPRKDGGWRLRFFDDPGVQNSIRMVSLLAAPGDGHATLASQLGLSRQESDALAGRREASGGHFEVVLTRAAHEAILEFLAAPEPTPRPLSSGVPVTRASLAPEHRDEP
jgi:hypothetical protein